MPPTPTLTLTGDAGLYQHSIWGVVPSGAPIPPTPITEGQLSQAGASSPALGPSAVTSREDPCLGHPDSHGWGSPGTCCSTVDTAPPSQMEGREGRPGQLRQRRGQAASPAGQETPLFIKWPLRAGFRAESAGPAVGEEEREGLWESGLHPLVDPQVWQRPSASCPHPRTEMHPGFNQGRLWLWRAATLWT